MCSQVGPHPTHHLPQVGWPQTAETALICHQLLPKPWLYALYTLVHRCSQMSCGAQLCIPLVGWKDKQGLSALSKIPANNLGEPKGFLEHRWGQA